MRKLALAATIALAAAAFAAPSLARPWTDARLVMEIPNSGGWSEVDGSRQSVQDRVYVETAAPDDDCAFYSVAAQIANAAVARSAITEDSRFTPEYLQQVATMFPRITPEGATVSEQTMDMSGPWPIRRVTFRAGDSVSHAAIQWRPGLQLIAMCARYQGAASNSSRYDAIFRSIGHPNDAAWLAEAQNTAAAPAAAEPAAPEAEEAAPERRRRRD
jgi:hypothetical protein